MKKPAVLRFETKGMDFIEVDMDAVGFVTYYAVQGLANELPNRGNEEVREYRRELKRAMNRLSKVAGVPVTLDPMPRLAKGRLPRK